MKIYLAPLQGLTDWIFRESFTESIAAFDKTFTPFVRVQNGAFYRPGQCNDLLPDNNTQQTPVPQFLGNDTESFRSFERLCIQYGYQEVNINMGCPFPMVTGRRFGAGLLPFVDEVRQLLEGVFQYTSLKVSLKCRLGQENVSEFDALMPLFNEFPLEEIILHPRLGKQQYKGIADMDAFAVCATQLKPPVCYNGDLMTLSDLKRLYSIAPHVDRIMIGRGVLQNPFLLSQIRSEELSVGEKRLRLAAFHRLIIEKCHQKYSGDHHFLKHLQELWSYQSSCFVDGHRLFRKLKKCRSLVAYEELVFEAIGRMDFIE